MPSRSLADKLGLIFTSAGSLRRVASLVGVSHQKIGRILHGQASERVLSDPGLIAAVDTALAIHTDVARDQARAHGLPFNDSVPVFYERLPFSSGGRAGVLGDRVGALHMHWVSDAVRNEWLVKTRNTGKFYAATVQSIINLAVYNTRAESRERGKRDKTRNAQRLQMMRAELIDYGYADADDLETMFAEDIVNLWKELRADLAEGEGREVEDDDEGEGEASVRIALGTVSTSITPMRTDTAFDADMMISEINNKLRERHEPATGDPGTVLAKSVLLQVDTRAEKDKRFRKSHPIPRYQPPKKRAKARHRR